LKLIAKAGRHLEITTLIIPGRNDSEQEMEMEAKWISEELGNETPLHLSRYFPRYKRDDPATPESVLGRLYDTASKHLKYVYVGNASEGNGQDTKCSKCGKIVTRRSGYNTRLLNLDSKGKCSACGNSVYRNFTLSSGQRAEPPAELIGANEKIFFHQPEMRSQRFGIIGLFRIVNPFDQVISQSHCIGNYSRYLFVLFIGMKCAKSKTV